MPDGGDLLAQYDKPAASDELWTIVEPLLSRVAAPCDGSYAPAVIRFRLSDPLMERLNPRFVLHGALRIAA
jgi:hypothetical protein